MLRLLTVLGLAAAGLHAFTAPSISGVCNSAPSSGGRAPAAVPRLHASPNPLRECVTIRWSAPSSLAPCPSSPSLYDASGRLALARTLDLSVSRPLSLAALPPGVYYARLGDSPPLRLIRAD